MTDRVYAVVVSTLKAVRKLYPLVRIFRGYLVFCRIRAKFPSSQIFVYDYSGIGDVYVICGLIKANYQRINNGNFVLILASKKFKKIVRSFGFKNYIITSEQSVINITLFSMAAPRDTGIRNITPFPRFTHTDLAFRYGGVFFTIAEMYQYWAFMLNEEASFQYPEFIPNYQQVDDLFAQKSLVPGKTVILAPTANTIICFSDDFWETLVAEMANRGFTVCTNVSGKEKPVPNTKPIFVSFEDAEQVLKRAGLFIALRSGICDVVCNAECKKIILYPDYRIFNSSMYEFCSFKKMGIGRDIVEIQGSLNDEEMLLEKILEEVDEK